MGGRQHDAAAALFCSADERMSKEACLVQTPTLPGLVSEETGNALFRLSLFLYVSLFLIPCTILVYSISSIDIGWAGEINVSYSYVTNNIMWDTGRQL